MEQNTYSRVCIHIGKTFKHMVIDLSAIVQLALVQPVYNRYAHQLISYSVHSINNEYSTNNSNSYHWIDTVCLS